LTAALFRPAYLKFLLVASPAYCLLLGLGIAGSFLPSIGGWRRPGGRLSRSKFAVGGHPYARPQRRPYDSATLGGQLLAVTLIALPSLLSLNAAYHAPAFRRDNYRGVAASIQAIATAEDAVILHAPGQQEVFGYYYHSGPNQAAVYPLPRQRPLDPAATLAELETIAAQARYIYAVYWATQEADPEGLIETWLNQHTFKASDSWFGNVRLVRYAAPPDEMTFNQVDFQLGEQIKLTEYGFLPQQIAPGEILQLDLRWQIDNPLSEDYTVFVQLLDGANHLVGQRDAQPLLPTTAWPVNQVMIDRRGLVVELGTPPGPHRLIGGLYNSATGVRLPAESGQDYLELGTIQVVQNPTPLPLEAFRIHHLLQKPPLVGYDIYKLGHASRPDTPLHPGDPLHLNLYWQKPAELPAQDNLDLRLVNRRGEVVASWPGQAAGIDYPMVYWAEDEIVRGQFDLFLSNAIPGIYRLEIVLGEEKVGVIRNIEIVE
jgi:hypothetical protein